MELQKGDFVLGIQMFPFPEISRLEVSSPPFRIR